MTTAEILNRSTNDPALQIAPKEDDGPDFNLLKTAFEKTVRDCQPFIDQCRQNYQTRFALWAGQSADGKKHAREGDKIDPTPWEGASDLRVYLTDEAINSKVAMLCMAFRKASIVANPVEGNDVKRSKAVSCFFNWLTKTQIPEIDREVELLANYLNQTSAAATGQFWETIQENTRQTITVADFQKQFPQVDVIALINDDSVADDLKGILENNFGVGRRRANKMLKDLRESGQTTITAKGRTISRPVIRAFNLNEDLFIPSFSTDLEQAPYVFRVQYFTAEKLRSFVNTDGWDKNWVEAAIQKCRGQWVTIYPQQYMQPLSRSFIFVQQRFTDLIGVVYAYQRLSDEDGVPGIYLTIFNPLLAPDATQQGYATSGLLGYAHGQYPFVLHRREFLSRRLHDSRGIPEVGKPVQDQVKAHKDSRIDAASIAVVPPMGYPIGRPPARWGAGAKIPERRQGEYHFMDRPAPDMSTDESERLLREGFDRYCGFVSADTDPQFSSLKNQQEVNKFLKGFEKAFRQIWSLYKQFGNDKVYFRVTGFPEPQLFERGPQNEDFDFYLSWDVQSMDFEKMEAKFEAMGKLLMTFDKNAQADYGEFLQIGAEIIDPNWAERIIKPQMMGQQQAIKDEKEALTKIFAGLPEDISLGASPDIGLQIMQQWLQQPDIAARYQGDEAFRKRVETRAKQYNMQKMQQQNAIIGRYGAMQ